MFADVGPLVTITTGGLFFGEPMWASVPTELAVAVMFIRQRRTAGANAGV